MIHYVCITSIIDHCTEICILWWGSCRVKPKQGTVFNRHSSNAVLVSEYLNQASKDDYNVCTEWSSVL